MELKRRISPQEAWDLYVGSQTPEEFVELSREKGIQDVEMMCLDYVQELPQMFREEYAEGQLAEISRLLVEYIEKEVKAAAEK